MERFTKHIDKKFASYPKSRALEELKEELITTLTERYQEYMSQNISEDDSYKMAIESIGDCKEAVNLIESGIDKKTKALRLGVAIWASALYWLTVATTFLTVSLISKKWGYTWIIYPIAAEIYFITAIALIFTNGQSLGKAFKIRISAMLLFLIITIGAYLLISFFTRAWAITWIIFLLGFSVTMIFDAILIRKIHRILFSVYVCLTILLFASASHQLISYYKIISWSLSWLIYLFAVIAILIYNFIKVFIKYKSETAFK